ncbi:LysR family transcriptional regulator [Algiphilus sp.]|uniref:LysR family transcriptional regulator n=1 Tax=Algiphilus sp. TaxID=1872431 RepID=UPI003B522CCA
MDRFQEMQTFAAVVDAGSFIGAADTLGLSKAAVSRHVNELEARLGVRLLHRTTRRLSLTSEGEVFLGRARDLLSILDEAEAEVTSSSVSARGRLRINVPVTFGIRQLAPLWSIFLAQHPQVELDVTLADRTVDLIEEGFDLAVRIGTLSSSSLISRKLATTRLIMCASPEYLAAHGTPATPAELGQHAVIVYSYAASGDEWRLEGPAGTVSARTRPCFRSNNGDTCRAAALAGKGIVLQPDFLVGEDIQSGKLVELMPEYSAAKLGVYAVYPSRRLVALKVRALVDFLVQRFSTAKPF